MRIPTYTAQQGIPSSTGGPRASADAFGAGALEPLAQGIDGLARAATIKGDEDAKAWFGKASSDANLAMRQYMLDAQSATAPGAPDFTGEFLKQHEDYFMKLAEQAPNEQARVLLEDYKNRSRTNFGAEAQAFQAGEGVRHRVEQYITGIDSDAKALMQTPKAMQATALEEAVGKWTALADSMNASPDVRYKLRDAARKSLAEAVVASEIETPDGAEVIAGSKRFTGGFDGAVEAVLANEGGFVAVDGASGAPANFGINQKAHPGVDVKNLTREQAVEIYKKEYWDRYGIDALPPASQLVVFDGVVNHGSAFAKKLVTAAKGGASPEELLAMRREEYQRLAQSPKHAPSFNGWMNRLDKIGKLSVGKTANVAFDLMTADEQRAWQSRAETKVREFRAIARVELEEHVADTQAMALTGKTDPRPLKMDDFKRAYEPEQVADRWAEYLGYLDLGANINALKGKTNAEIIASVEGQKPKEGSNYAEGQARYAALAQAAQQVLTAREKAPAEQMIQESATVKSAYDARSKEGADPASTAQAYARTTLAQQKRLGVMTPRILTDAEKDGIVAQFNNQQQGGEDAFKLIGGLAQQWGAYWPQVYGELSDKLGGAPLVIGSGVGNRVGALLAQLDSIKVSDLQAQVANLSDASEAPKEVLNALEPFRTSLVNTNPQAGVRTFNAFYEQATKLAYYYMQRGDNAGTAAKRAADDIIMSKYYFTDTYRVPFMDEKSGQPLDTSAVRSAANSAINKLTPDDIALPQSMTDMVSKEQFAASVAEYGYWVTNADESGLALYHNGEAVFGKDGKPLQRTWADLQTKGRDMRRNAKEPPIGWGMTPGQLTVDEQLRLMGK